MIEYIFAILILLFVIINIYLLYKRIQLKPKKQNANQKHLKLHIGTLVLLNDEMKPVKEWNLRGKSGLLIGRMEAEEPDEINLCDVAAAALIDKEHALLNYTHGNWYIEDLDTKNGTGIQKGGKGEILWLIDQTPYQIQQNDILYIADTALLIK